MTDAAELVAKAIARMVPIQGSQWNPGFGERFPQEYSEAEKRLIRAIAQTAVETLAAQQDGAKWPYRYAHMCRDDHLQIGHLDSEHEQCPLCRALGELERLHETTGWQSTADLLKQLRCTPEQ